MTLRVNVFKPLFGLSHDDLSRLWGQRNAGTRPSEYVTFGSGTGGVEVKAAKVDSNGSGKASNAGTSEFLIDKRRCTDRSDSKGVLDKRCALILSNGSVEFKYSGIGLLGEICGSVDTSTGDVSGCYRALFVQGRRIDLLDEEVSPYLPEIEDMIRLFNSHLSG